MAYTLTIDACRDVERLADIERGGPVRTFKFRTLADAKAARNIALFAMGAAMQSGPRRLLPGQSWPVRAEDTVFTIERKGE